MKNIFSVLLLSMMVLIMLLLLLLLLFLLVLLLLFMLVVVRIANVRDSDRTENESRCSFFELIIDRDDSVWLFNDFTCREWAEMRSTRCIVIMSHQINGDNWCGFFN